MPRQNVDEFPLGARIKYFRKRRKLTQQEFAELCGVSQTSISLIEMSQLNPSLKVLREIAKHLDVHLARLFESDRVAVFDLEALSKKYDSYEKLPDHLINRFDDIVQYLRFIDWKF